MDVEPIPTCQTCQLIARRDVGDAPFWDCFYRTECWDVVHHRQTTLPGWLVLVCRRHITALDALSESEAVELGQLIRQTSRALKQVVGCAKTYVIQLAEHPQHPHVHVHIIPRMATMPPEHQGMNVFRYTSTPVEEAVSEAEMNAIAHQVLAAMQADA